MSFQKIAQLILEQFPHVKRPLVPKNVPWFTVHPEDFPNRQIAAQIMELYAEDRGDGRRLYRFPVIFPTDTYATQFRLIAVYIPPKQQSNSVPTTHGRSFEDVENE